MYRNLPFFIFAVLQVLPLNASTLLASQKQATRPNIIFILTDDQRYDALGFMKRIPWLETPHLDRLRAGGTHFTNAFTTHSLCAPSRAGFLTGMHSHHNGITTNQEGRELNPSKTPTFGQHLQAHGYDTAFIGKWHLGDFDDPRPGWSYWCSFRGQGRYDKNILNINGERILKVGYVSDVLTDYAIDFIQRERDAPFMVYLSHKAVHQPFSPAERHAGQYAGLPLPEPINWTDDMADKPAWQRELALPPERSMRIRRKNPLPIPEGRKAPPWSPQAGAGQQRDYLRSISAVDDGVGRILDLLEARGELENTIIVFAGDNGYFHGEHGLGDKRLAYNESMRIPFIMQGPGVKPGSTVDDIILNLDLAPTFLEAAQVEIPENIQGRSLLPLARGETPLDWRTAFLFTYWRDLITNIPRMTAARSLDALYVNYPDGDSIDELYDLASDPGEQANLATLNEAIPLREKMQQTLEQLMTEADYRAVVPRPDAEALNGRPLGVMLDKNFGAEGLSCTGSTAGNIPMSHKLDPHFGCMILETVVTPESNGIILSMGKRVSGFFFFIEKGVPGFGFSAGDRFHALDGDADCLGRKTHLLVEMDNYTSEARFFVNGELVQTETIYCKLPEWNRNFGDIYLGSDPEPLVDPYDLSKMGGFKGTIWNFKIQRKRMTFKALESYARQQSAAALKR